jgi:hypothetical protein
VAGEAPPQRSRRLLIRQRPFAAGGLDEGRDRETGGVGGVEPGGHNGPVLIGGDPFVARLDRAAPPVGRVVGGAGGGEYATHELVAVPLQGDRLLRPARRGSAGSVRVAARHSARSATRSGWSR